MGYRIELEEIEAALSTLPSVEECAVIYQKLGEGLGQILAFVATSAPLSPEGLLHKTAAIVPTYMMPRRVIIMNVLPKNANGKIDRVALHVYAASS
jgi:Acyl-coenzyme A synthetases/AMP-(fatty) acid ligases